MKAGEKRGLLTKKKERKGQEGEWNVGEKERVSSPWQVGSAVSGAGSPGLEFLTPGMLLKLPEGSPNRLEQEERGFQGMELR